MKRKRFFFRILLFCTIFFLLLQLLAMDVLETSFTFPILTLLVPVFCILNFLFFVYWILRLDWPALLFILTFVFSFPQWQRLYQIKGNEIRMEEGVSIMSFNVRSFNRFQWIKTQEIPSRIEAFIQNESPDLVCFQEFAKSQAPSFSAYPYQEFIPYQEKGSIGTAIFSKYPIKNTKAIVFPSSSNGGMQADLIQGNDTLRIYNLHFESLRIDVRDTLLTAEYSQKIRTKLSEVFLRQQQQINAFQSEAEKSTLPSILCTDLNNTAFSKSYQLLTRTRNDSFVLGGEGSGRTYRFPYYPMRIDFIMPSEELKVIDFITHKVKLSDHYPITAKIHWPFN